MSTDGSIPAAAGFRRSSLALAAGLLAVGCTSVNTTTETFAGTRWRVASIAAMPTPQSPLYQLEFRDGQIGGRFGCNNFGGSYRVQGEQLVTGDIASTLMGCPEPAATHETRGFAILARPMAITWQSGGRLTLSNDAGSIELEMIPASP